MNTQAQAAQNTTYDLPGSAFVVLTGNTGDGKSEQMTRLLSAKVDGRSIVAPILMLVAEASSEGTAGSLMADPSLCLVWGVTTCDEASDALAAVFPEGRAPLTLGQARAHLHALRVAEAKESKTTPPPALPATPNDHLPIRAVGVDSISTLYAGQMAAAGNAGRKPGAARDARAMKNIETSMRDQAKVAMPRCIALIDRLSGVTQRHRGTLVVVACHVRKQVEALTTGEGSAKEVHRSVIGWAPDLGRPEEVRAGCLATGYSALWQNLAFKANVIWHLFAVTPDFRQVPRAKINEANMRPTFGAITMRGKYADLGDVSWVKRQGGDGWLGSFDSLPPYWHPDAPWDGGDEWPGPDLGAVLAHCVSVWRKGQVAS